MNHLEGLKKGTSRKSNYISKVTPDNLSTFERLLQTAIPELAKSGRLKIDSWDQTFKSVGVKDLTEPEYEKVLEETYRFLQQQGLNPEDPFDQQLITNWLGTAYDLWRDGDRPNWEELSERFESKSDSNYG